MKQVTGLTSTYSSDEFGVCSALYELGGMVVMHDASGCNSTYTTHDEPRWYTQDSMIFISALSEKEAILGDDNKLIRDLVETAGELHPKFLALVGAPIPYMIGTDLDAIARIVSKEINIPCFAFEANGMHHYTHGISMALEKIVGFAVSKENGESIGNVFVDRKLKSDVNDRECSFDMGTSGMPKKISMEHDGYESSETRIRVNILGATPLDFSVNGSVESIQNWLSANDMSPGVCLSMGCVWEDLWKLKDADVNLVVSYGGLAAARILEKQCGIPYVVGVPFGETFSGQLAKALARAVETRKSGCAYQTGEMFVSNRKDADDVNREKNTARVFQEKKIVLLGESVFSGSLAAAIEADTGYPVRVLCPVDTEDFLLRKGDLRTPEEDDVMREIAKADVVIADPLYRPIAHGKTFIDLPHEAFSGRIYDGENPNLIAKNLAFF